MKENLVRPVRRRTTGGLPPNSAVGLSTQHCVLPSQNGTDGSCGLVGRQMGVTEDKMLHREHLILIILMLTQMALWPVKKRNSTLTTWIDTIGWTSFVPPPNFFFKIQIKHLYYPWLSLPGPPVLVKISAQDDDGHTFLTPSTLEIIFSYECFWGTLWSVTQSKYLINITDRKFDNLFLDRIMNWMYPPKFLCCSPNLQCDGVWRWGFGEVLG